MTRPVRLLEEALHLSDDDRAALAASLIESLDPDFDEDATAAWGDEVRGRLDELDRGESTGIPWPEARRRVMDDADEPAQD
jgi:putative addiction module component (TIGR02574 family)